MFKFVVRLGLLALMAFLPADVTAQTVTLYSVIKHRGEDLPSCYNLRAIRGEGPCDFSYGNLYAGEDLDWFQTANSQGSRTLIKDLGKHEWSDVVSVPVVEPLPKLLPGEQRQVSIDTSGADGPPGANGAPGCQGCPSANRDSILSAQHRGVSDAPSPELLTLRAPIPATPVPPAPASPRKDGKTKVSPVFVKAIVGHLYVIHVVDDFSDYYALFRVDALDSGDNCTISWKLIDAPKSLIENREK